MAHITKRSVTWLKPKTETVPQPVSEDSKEQMRETSKLYTWKWAKLRQYYRSLHPLCERCESLGRIRPAALVHHRVPVKSGGGLLDVDNLEALCSDCHTIRHKELRGIGGSKVGEARHQ